MNTSSVRGGEIEHEFWKTRCLNVVEALRQNGFEAEYASDKTEARKRIADLIPGGSKVGRCGSTTMVELGVFAELSRKRCIVIDPYLPNISRDDTIKKRREALLADVLLCSANAVTWDGRVISVDGVGNRVAGMIFGPRQVIMAVGKNKIVHDLKEGMARIKNVAAPMNARRLVSEGRMSEKIPCFAQDRCPGQCSFSQRMCNVTVILEKKPLLSNILIFVVGANLGF